jgi:hypothetical protein
MQKSAVSPPKCGNSVFGYLQPDYVSSYVCEMKTLRNRDKYGILVIHSGHKEREVHKMRIQSMRLVAKCLVMAMLIISIAPRVEAGISPSEIIGLSQTDILADQGKIQNY